MGNHGPGSRSSAPAWGAGRLVLFFAATLLGVALLLGFVLGEAYREASRQAETDARNIAVSLEARLDATLRHVHADLDQLAATLPVDAFDSRAEPRLRSVVSRDLQLYAARFPPILGYRIVDAAGDVLYGARPPQAAKNIRDRGYFKALTGISGPVPVFSDVLAEGAGDKPVLMIAAPVRDRAGGFLGGVVVPLDIAYLQRMFAEVNLGPNGVLTLRRSDNGRLVLRRSARPAAVNGVLANNPMHMRIEAGDRDGTIRYRAALDGVERLYAYRRVGDYPFYVAAGVATVDYLAGWKRMVAITGLSFAMLVVTLSLVLARLLRAEREEAAISRRLRESEARYRMLADNSHDVIWTLDVPTRRFTYVSPSVRELRGYTPEEVMAQTLAETLTPDSAARVSREIDQRLRRLAAGDETAQVVSSDLDQICKDGSVVTTEVVSSYVRDPDGVVRTILGITRNINERKAAERALQEINRRQLAQIEEIGRLQAALQEQAVRDGLTGLYNRRYLDETLAREVSRAQREGDPLSLVMLDIDHFKSINDSHGHQVGDEALRMLAETLLANIRPQDLACRYGGEEFLILLPGLAFRPALERADAWRRKVEGLSVMHGGVAIRFTVSLGVASYPEHGRSPDDLTRCADRALYRAKHEGRNRVGAGCP